jgi:hypothetical protein
MSKQFRLDGQQQLQIEREWSMPSRWTFEIDSVSEFLHAEVTTGVWIDPFAGKNSPADITNDLNPNISTDYTLKASEFFAEFDDGGVDGVILDPPYNATQLKRLYDDLGIETQQNDTNAGFYGTIRDETARVVKRGGKALSFGWDSNGVGVNRGFQKRRIRLVAHGSSRNDTICVSETKVEWE